VYNITITWICKPNWWRSAIVKWKWGAAPDEMLYKNQPGFIKFALGENVKQSNWGTNNPTVSHKLEC
jgi:hypothetical protein